MHGIVAATLVVAVLFARESRQQGVNVAVTNLIESVTTFSQCLELATNASSQPNGGVSCSSPDDGMVSLILQLTPQTGGGTVYEFDTTDPVVLGQLAPGVALQQALVTVSMARAGLAYQLQLIRYVPAAYFPQTVGEVPITGLEAVAPIFAVGTSLLTNTITAPEGLLTDAVGVLLLLADIIGKSCPAWNGLVEACNGVAEFDPSQPDPCFDSSNFANPLDSLPGLPLVNTSMMFRGLAERGYGNCTDAWCGVCYGPQGMSRSVCMRERFFWVYPIFRVYRIFPMPLMNTTITVSIRNLSPNSSATQPEVLTLGVSLNQAQIPGSQPLPLTVYSQNRRVQATFLGAQSLVPLPIQTGFIIAAEKNPYSVPSQVQPGMYDYACAQAIDQSSQDNSVYCPPYDAFEEGPVNPRCPDPNDVATCTGRPPYFWFWGINGRNNLNIGAGCNQFGITPDYYGRNNGQNAQAVCRNGLLSCVPGFWVTPAGYSKNMQAFVTENFEFCGWDEGSQTCTLSTQTPPNMPQSLGSDGAQSRVWLSQNFLQYIPFVNLGMSSRVQLLVSGSFVAQETVAGTGYLQQPPQGAGCVLVLGSDGSLFTTVCSTSGVPADFSVILNCSSPDYQVGVAEVSTTVQPGACTTVGPFRITLGGSQIVPNSARGCVVQLYNAVNTLLSTLGQNCTETNPRFLQAGAAGGGGETFSSENDASCPWTSPTCWSWLALDMPSWQGFLAGLLAFLVMAAIIIGVVMVVWLAISRI
jgi:hypothetical protein